MNGTITSVRQLFGEAAREIQSLLELRSVRGASPDALFAPVGQRLAALPLTRDEYAQLVNMLAAARGFLAQGEVGAARWTLGQMQRKLTRGVNSWAAPGSATGHVSRI